MEPTTPQDDQLEPPLLDPSSSQVTSSSTHRRKQQRPPTRRGASATWNRLKPIQQDPLQAYGLPSKGETRLNDPKAQESFYQKIVERYMTFCAESDSGEDLRGRFEALSLYSSQPKNLLPSKSATAAPSLPDQQDPPSANEPYTPETASQTELSSSSSSSASPKSDLPAILHALRKLREAIVSTRRTDMFAQRCYIFAIRAAILVRAWESYYPALQHLLTTIHPRTPLSGPELAEFAAYAVLDAACRTSDLGVAHALRVRYRLRDRNLRAVLAALVADDWMQFWRLRRRVDGYQRAILGFVEDDVRVQALKCLARTYFTAEKSWVEKAAGCSWPQLVAIGVGWVDEGDRVVIRKPKPKPT